MHRKRIIREESPFKRENLPYLIYDSVGAIVSQHTVDVAPEPIRKFSVITDDPDESDVVNHYVKHWKYRSTIHGIVPSIRPNYSQPYITHQVPALPFDIRYHMIPAMCVFDEFLIHRPDFMKIELKPEVTLRSLFNYPEVFSGNWKGPKLDLDNGFSLLNFLYEWKDSIRMFHDHFSRGKLADRWHDLISHNESLGVKAKALANERLSLEFGVKLFLADAKKLFLIIQGWKERADRYLGDASRIRAQRSVVPEYQRSWSSELIPAPIFEATNSYFKVSYELLSEVHGTLNYRVLCPEVKTMLSRLVQLSSSLGVKPDAGIVWDAIPLSFCVDWFINVSEWLHQYATIDWRLCDVRLLEFCRSGRVELRRSVTWIRDVPSNWTVPQQELVFSDATTYYLRERAEMPTLSTVNLAISKDGWKVKRILNALALAIQKIDQLPRWVAQAKQRWENLLASARRVQREAGYRSRQFKRLIRKVERAYLAYRHAQYLYEYKRTHPRKGHF